MKPKVEITPIFKAKGQFEIIGSDLKKSKDDLNGNLLRSPLIRSARCNWERLWGKIQFNIRRYRAQQLMPTKFSLQLKSCLLLLLLTRRCHLKTLPPSSLFKSISINSPPDLYFSKSALIESRQEDRFRYFIISFCHLSVVSSIEFAHGSVWLMRGMKCKNGWI